MHLQAFKRVVLVEGQDIKFILVFAEDISFE